MEASQCLRPLLAATPCDLSSTPPPSHSHLQHSAISFIYLIIVRPPLIALDDDPLSAASLSLSQIFLPPATSHESTANSLCKIHNIWLLHKFLAVDGFSIPRNAGQIDNMGFSIGREMRLRKNRWVCMKCAANEFAISPRYL